ncbi:MAG: PQQ-binding-like beta-propeller repeat protein [Methanoregulaceae archaeon]|nr:PQQ-binding-like beta-propeller repeat protein [Methanoregulaceae archaeon]
MATLQVYSGYARGTTGPVRDRIGREYQIAGWTRLVRVLIPLLVIAALGVATATAVPAWKFRSDLSNSGVYDDGGRRPAGDLNWTFPIGDMVRSSPAVVNGVVFFGSDDTCIYAVDAGTGVLLWKYATGSGVHSSPAVADGVVYAGSGDHKLYALDAASGAFLWDFQGDDSFASGPAIAGGTIYAGCLDGNLYALNASTGGLSWKYPTGAWIETCPAVVNGVVYFGSEDTNAYALNASTGALLWNYTTGSEVDSSPAVVNGTVYIGSDDGNLSALNASTGALQWRYKTGDEVRSSPAVADGVVYVGSYDHCLYALEASTGALLWKYDTGEVVYSSPAVANGVVYAGSLNYGGKSVHALDASDGTLLWDYVMGNTFSSPAVADGMVYIGSDNGSLYAFGTFPDEPPGSVTDLHATSTQQLRISWAWTDPASTGFSHVMVYLDGVFRGNVTKGVQSWTATGLAPSTAYTIGTRTVREDGRVNETWVNDTATTTGLSLSSLNPPEVTEGGARFTLDVYGTGFTTNTTVLWNGGGVRTQYVDPGHLTVRVSSGMIAQPRLVNISVYDSYTSELSNRLFLHVRDILPDEKAWRFRSDLHNTGVYDDGGTKPDGTLLWNYTTGGPVSSSPAVVDGVVYIGSQDSHLYALNASTGAFLWKYNTTERMDYVSSSPALADGIVYIGGMRNKIHAINASTGALLWKYYVDDQTTTRSSISSSPAVSEGIVYIGNQDGNVYAFDAAGGDLIWNYTISLPEGYDRDIFSSPAVADGIVFIRSYYGTLHALDAWNGASIWSYASGSNIFSSPAVANGVVYFGSSDNNTYALDEFTGALLWKTITDTSVRSYRSSYSSPAVANGVVYIGSPDNNTYALDASTGALLWTFTTGNSVSSSPAVADGVVYIGSWDNNTYALDASTGALLWDYTTGNRVLSSPAVADGIVYFGSNDRNVYAIGSSGTSPVANFTANTTTGFLPLTVQFTDSSTGAGPLGYQWRFGDGSPNATVKNPVHTYTVNGTYNVTLTVSNGAGTSTLKKPGYITALEPPITGGDKAYYLIHSNVEGAEVYFNGDWFEGTILNGTLLVQTCTTCTPVMTFTVKKCGYFPLTQNNTQFPGKDETADLYANLTAPKEPIITDFIANVTGGPAPLTVAFSRHGIGVAEVWNWSFGDGSYSEERSPVHTYINDGTYTVTLHESNSACQNGSEVKPDFIRAGTRPPFSADFTVTPVFGFAPMTVHCNDTSTGNPTFVFYDFGDGFGDTARNPVHTYRSSGTYTITQTILKFNTSAGSLQKSVAVKKDAITVGRAITLPPIAGFSASPINGTAPLAVTFTDESIGNPTFYQYDFGDGFKDSGHNPVHTYQLPGVYKPSLTVLKTDPVTGRLKSSVARSTIFVYAT